MNIIGVEPIQSHIEQKPASKACAGRSQGDNGENSVACAALLGGTWEKLSTEVKKKQETEKRERTGSYGLE